MSVDYQKKSTEKEYECQKWRNPNCANRRFPFFFNSCSERDHVVDEEIMHPLSPTVSNSMDPLKEDATGFACGRAHTSSGAMLLKSKIPTDPKSRDWQKAATANASIQMH